MSECCNFAVYFFAILRLDAPGEFDFFTPPFKLKMKSSEEVQNKLYLFIILVTKMKTILKKITFALLVVVGISMSSVESKAVTVMFQIISGGSKVGVACQTGGSVLGTFSFDCSGTGVCWSDIGGGLGVVDLYVAHENDPLLFDGTVGEFVSFIE